MTNKRNRRTRAQMIADMEAKLEHYKALEDGKVDTSTENGVLKALRNRLRKTKTALRSASITLDGADSRSSIADKIAQTEKRLASQRETQQTAEEQRAALPFDITRLEALVEAAEAGEEVEFPNDLYRLPGVNDPRTDEEREADFIAKGEENGES
jgi:hypothetical protein